MNVYSAFKTLLPRDQLQSGEVVSLNPDGTSTLTLPAGGSVRVLGQDVAVGNRAFFQSGRIVGDAPDLPASEIEV